MPNFFFLLLNYCFSNLAIFYGLCILDISFLYWLLVGGVSDKHCLLSFFSLVLSCHGSNSGYWVILQCIKQKDLESLKHNIYTMLNSQFHLEIFRFFRITLNSKFPPNWKLGTCKFMFTMLSKTESPGVTNIETYDQRYSLTGSECMVHNINGRTMLPVLTVYLSIYTFCMTPLQGLCAVACIYHSDTNSPF